MAHQMSDTTYTVCNMVGGTGREAAPHAQLLRGTNPPHALKPWSDWASKCPEKGHFQTTY